MGAAYTVALVGFAENESATFESFFRLAARRPPAYRVQDEVMDAQLLIVNADNPQALHLVRYAELPAKVLLVGNSDGGTGWPMQRKPIKLVSVLAELDRLVGVAVKPVAAPAPALRPGVVHQPVPSSQGADRGFAATEPLSSAMVPLPSAAPSAAAPVVPATVQPRRRSADTEFPATRPMVRSMLAPTAALAGSSSSASSARASAPARAPAHADARAGDDDVRRRNEQAARPGVMRLTDFGGLDELPTPPRADANAGTGTGASARNGGAGTGSNGASKPRSPRSVNTPAPAVAPVVQHGDMLLVSESLVEGRILHKRFKKYGLNIDWSREGKQALVMLKAHAYRLVAVDRLNGEPDAYQVCRAAKQSKQANGQPPVVVMFAPNAGSMDRIKAGLAGSDAYLSRSVVEAEFYKLLAQHRLVDLDGFEKTNISY